MLVTGAAAGIGACIAERFSRAGGRVACLDIACDGLDTTMRVIEEAGGRAYGEVVDITDWASLNASVAAAEAVLGPVNIAIVNAGVAQISCLVEELDPAEWRRILDANLTGAFLTAKAVIPQMRRAGGGVLLFLASVGGIRPAPMYGAYVASKYGVIGLMGTLANELAADGIRVNAICPGTVETGMFEARVIASGRSRDDVWRASAREHLIPRLVRTEDVANAALWLASDLSAMVTGVAFPVDGGSTARWQASEVPGPQLPPDV